MREKFVTFLPDNKSVPIKNEASVLELALKHGIEINHSCGGMGSCTTCRIFVENNVDNLPPRTELEQEIATDRGFQEHERLSCQIAPHSGWRVRVPSGKT